MIGGDNIKFLRHFTEQLASSMRMRLELSPELTNHRRMRNRNRHRLVSLVLKSPTLWRRYRSFTTWWLP